MARTRLCTSWRSVSESTSAGSRWQEAGRGSAAAQACQSPLPVASLSSTYQLSRAGCTVTADSELANLKFRPAELESHWQLVSLGVEPLFKTRSGVSWLQLSARVPPGAGRAFVTVTRPTCHGSSSYVRRGWAARPLASLSLGLHDPGRGRPLTLKES